MDKKVYGADEMRAFALILTVCLRPVPLIGRLAMDKCREMSRKTRKVLIQ